MKFQDYVEEILNSRQMKLGKEVEKEHLDDPKIREALKKELNKIHGAIDTVKEKNAESNALTALVTPHLREIKKYYNYLIPMEKKAKADQSRAKK